jgi:YVTN family beta-propeller protein
VYVGLFNHNQIAAIDTATDEVHVAASSQNINARAHAPRPSHGGSFIFVPHEIGDEVTALDANSGRLIGSVSAGSMPTEVLPAADGRRLFVAMRGEGRIKVIDLATAQVTGAVSVGTQPESLMLANDQRTLVSSLRGSPATLAFVDATTLTLLGTVPIAGSGTFGDLAVLSPNGRYVYATFDASITGTGGVAVVDAQNGQKVGSWLYPGVGRPHGIAYSTTPLNVP